MRKFYWFFVCILALAFPACDKEEESGNAAPTPIPAPTTPPTPPTPEINVDSVAPQIELFSPTEDDTYLAIGKVIFYATAKDDKELKAVRVFLVSPSGTRRSIENLPSGLEEDAKTKTFLAAIIPGGAVTGVHSLLIEAEDMGQNIATKTIRINVIAEELSKLDFNTAFTSTGWFEQVDGNYGFLDKERFNYAFHAIINQNEWDYAIKPAFVDEFGADFGGHSQLWSKWDADNNGYLEYSEFKKGLEDLRFFELWDKNQDDLISEEEMAYGIGVLWDVNKDKVVTADEFEKKLRKYFLI